MINLKSNKLVLECPVFVYFYSIICFFSRICFFPNKIGHFQKIRHRSIEKKVDFKIETLILVICSKCKWPLNNHARILKQSIFYLESICTFPGSNNIQQVRLGIMG